MGRSVMTLSGATAVAYDIFEPTHYCDDHDMFTYECGCDDVCEYGCDHAPEWEDYLDGIKERAQELWPSMESADEWIGDEIHVIAKNAHSVIAVAEYSGTVSINLAADYDRTQCWADDSEIAGLGEQWRKKISEKFERTFGSMYKIGTFSNGESVYKRSA